jgi:N-acetylmuramoyl-L-alanine amidase
VRGRSGAIEKRITLETARRLKTLLESRLAARVILTREDDVAVALEARTAIANTNRADLFVSLHFNAAPSPDAAGAVVYSLLLDREGEQARQQARLAAAAPGTRTLDIVPWEFAQAWHLDASSGLAALVAESLGRNTMFRSASVRRAPLRVLGDVNAPAVLVELAYLTNSAQEQLAGSEEFTRGVGEALVSALARFLGHAEGAAALP